MGRLWLGEQRLPRFPSDVTSPQKIFSQTFSKSFRPSPGGVTDLNRYFPPNVAPLPSTLAVGRPLGRRSCAAARLGGNHEHEKTCGRATCDFGQTDGGVEIRGGESDEMCDEMMQKEIEGLETSIVV